MGDLVQYDKPKEIEEFKEKKKKRQEEKRKEEDVVSKKAKMDINKGETVLSTDVTEMQIYRPRTAQTKAVYEMLLNRLQQPLGDQAPDVLRGAADEVLAAIKTEGVLDSERKKDVEEVLGSITDEYFAELFRLAKQITDFGADVEDEEQDDTVRTKEGLDDAAGVAVVFDEDDEDEGADYIHELGDDDDDDDDDEGGKMDDDRDDRGIHATLLEADDEEEEAKKEDKYNVDIQKIDAHWLQRELGKIFQDPNKCIATEKEILSILPIKDLQQCENRLVQVLQYENFEFTKLLLKNRLKILYCTRLGQAQTEEDKTAVLEDMRNTPEAQAVLEELDKASKKRDREHDINRDLRKEVRQLQLRGIREKERGMDDEGQALGGRSRAKVAEEQQKKPSHMLDLDSLSFARGSHFMANAKCQLPTGSFRVQKKGYEEVHVKPFKHPDITPDELIPLSKLPTWCQEAFPGATKLNTVQSKVFPTAFQEHSENMLVCAPTGSGKTNVAMLTILNVMNQFRLKDGSFDLAGFKIVYIAPMKALVQEVVQSFTQRLEKAYGVTIRELSGDVNLTKAQIDETQIIVTTPEKWDIITRKAGDQRAYTQLVRLVIIDEIHLLHDSRGPVLEAIVARTIRQIETTQEHIRLVGLSATLPNYEDVAIFLRVNPEKGLHYFGNHYRPVPLEQTYIGVTDKKAIKRFNTMNEVCYEKLMENAGKNQVLIFVHSRKETVKTAQTLRDLAMQNDTLAKFLQEDSASREILQTEAQQMKTPEVQDLLPYGFAVHHAGLPRADRKLVEDLYADRHIQVLVSTATLAWGVNLPAHTVIIKGTQVYNPQKGAWDELSSMDMMQMLGRSGRPQYDKTGHGIVITQHSELQYYLSLMNQQLPIESQVLSVLPDMVNAELVLGTIQTRQDAVNWLGYTYLYVRMMRAPRLYGISPDEAEEDRLLEQRRVDLIHSALTMLDKNNLIKYDKRTGQVQVTALGRVASHYYIQHPSIATYNDHLRPMMSDIELLRLFSLSHEFKYIPVREEEKVEMQKLVERVPVPVKGSTDEPSSKVNVLLQAYISKLKLEGFALMSDMVYVQQSAGRIMRAIFEICLRRGWAALALRALNWCKMIDKRMWASQTPLRHFKGLAEDILRKVEKKDFAWERYYDLSSAEIGELIRFPKMGKTIHKLVHQFPKLDLSAYVQPITRSCLMVELTITPDFQWDPKVHGRAEPFWVFVEDVNGEQILHQEMFVLQERGAEEEHTLNFTVPITEPLPPQYFIRVVSDRWINAQTLLPVSFRHLILPDKYPPHTELLDLQPLPLTALRCPDAEKLYAAQGLKVFNPIQTQTFSMLYASNDNVLVCAPAASGKIICAEFAVLKMLTSDDPVKRCVYVAPHASTARERFNEWSFKFGKTMGYKVAELVGETTSDVKILEDSHVIITTPEKWDLISRRWKTRKSVQEVRLFVVDELHLLDSDVGPTLEAVVSRMRYISVQVQSPIRIVALAASLANAKDVGEWIGAGSSGLFNFSPNVRTVPLELVIQGFDIHHRSTRLLAMSRPVYQSIKHYSPEKPVIVFVPDRKQARMTAIDLLLHAASDDKPKRFLHVPDDAMRPHLAAAREKSLKQTLEYGVGFLHEGFSQTERAVIERLFEAGAIQVLVATEQLCWGMTMLAHLVVIMDTKKFDGRENRYVDYPIHDVLQMMGRASRPGIDQSGMVVLLTQNSKKEYYKKFIYEPLPVESHLDQRMADHMNAEIVMKTIENKQDAVDWLTWTFYYRRLSQNPNYYGLQGVTHQHLSDHLSEVVENTVEGLERFGCCSIEDDVDLAPANLGLIGAYYYIRHTTIETFSRCVNESTKRKGLLDILCAASEFDAVPVRSGEEATLYGLAQSLGMKVDKDKLNDPHTKAQLLLNAHFTRSPITTDLSSDQKFILEHSVRLLQGLVDVISSCGWLTPALSAMELSQMVVQATTSTSSPLMQLPHFTPAMVEKAKKMKVEDIFDVMGMDDAPRDKLLDGLSQSQLADVARACNRFPGIALEYKVQNSDALTAGGSAKISVKLSREAMEEEGATVGPVYAMYYPKEKEEIWWLVVGGPKSALVAIKRITISKVSVLSEPAVANVKLEIELGEDAGGFDYTLYLMSDSYQGCDQEYNFKLNVRPHEPRDRAAVRHGALTSEDHGPFLPPTRSSALHRYV
ncbi:Snrnp200 [Symbiodinium necroappetens]|uniref:Snrnp200 protein n=1 Tax=Symbiodinium necroappetens TaxID=1628268 RepID=A0A812Z1I1_9DINO|nr:Snrnp200 [Symbiodinium necroappetens]